MANNEYNPFSLQGKTIVVTGASSGIGQQCAIDCSRMGARVIAIARNRQRLEETLQQMEGDDNIVVSCDLTDSAALVSMVKDVVERCGKIDGIVNCAGISTTLPLKFVDVEKLDQFFRANVYSAIELTREFTKAKNCNACASVIFFSSIMGCVGDVAKSIYSMTKGALISGTRSLACELAKRSIRVNCISPGVIITPINANLPHIADTEARKALEEKHLLGLGETSDIANACIYLLSDASRWITGQNLIVDGGYTAR